MVKEFVEGWDLLHTLGEGAYGEVKLLVNQTTGEAVAVKVLNLSNRKDAAESVRKEICIHRMLSHENIIKFFGQRSERSCQYIFLEYAAGGELFDRIEPDIGMPQPEAQRYFAHLLSGVEYLHSKGVTHRDLKPENLLLDAQNILKISDFGMATVFRYQGKERMLTKRCGTLPYIAPEVLVREYNAEPADIWSCGVILVALLAGELPWDKPQYDCKEYREWEECKVIQSPWNKIDNLALSLLRKILLNSPSKRYNISQIKSHQWINKNIKSKALFKLSTSNNDYISRKRTCSEIDHPAVSGRDEVVIRLSSSQPEPFISDDSQVEGSELSIRNVVPYCTSFSQPVHPEHMLLSSQLQATPGSSQSPMQRLVKRMTRFFVSTDLEMTLKELSAVFEKLGYSWKENSGQITVTTQDRRKMMLTFKANLIEMTDILVDFRLSRGDGLEFKRHFLVIRNLLHDIIVKGPIMWPLAVTTEM
ncbi:serine/threonine-protein kinase Chk1-like [Limulus polyphemus]|uniref:non-specific serine/threonine protein kinase n=1 Tax=Limulus polyphemus TaxID=6850 RepID=A0ABM1T8Q9_LIMPO|nr:serine/threonine-protein kinase Chk1-like [Limulus polyphemus]XP_022252265.1 serine/threonine-protein kinase Chk1-like [Limulus polyphemus]